MARAILRISWVLPLLALVLLTAGCTSTVRGAEQAVDPSTGELVRFYQQRLGRDPADFISYNRLAGAYIQQGRETGDVTDYARAEAALQKSLQILPNANYSAIAQMAVVFNVKHQFADARVLALRAIALDPKGGLGYAALGDAEAALGEYEEAQEAYETMADLEPGLSSFSRQAYLHELRGELEQAEELWWRAHKSTFSSPTENSAWVHVQLGHFYFNQGNLPEAKKQYEFGLKEFPNYVHALAGVGKVYAAQRQYSKAISFYRRAIERVPLPEYVIALGDIFTAAGQKAEADRQYALVQAIDRLYLANGINTDLQMALYAADHGQPTEAVARARAAKAASPGIQAADVLAWALYQAAQYQEALQQSQEALRLGTKNALMLFHAGMISYRLGEFERARAYLESALAINPYFSVLYGEGAKHTLAELQGKMPPSGAEGAKKP